MDGSWNARPSKALHFVPSAKKDLLKFPEEVIEVVADALNVACHGEKSDSAKPLKGYGGAGVLEIIDEHDGNTYRAVYTVKFAWAVYVLHAFQKKSKSGIATPKQDMDLIAARLKDVEAEWNKTYKQRYLEDKARRDKELKEAKTAKFPNKKRSR